jgi:hypothetical protein
MVIFSVKSEIPKETSSGDNRPVVYKAGFISFFAPFELLGYSSSGKQDVLQLQEESHQIISFGLLILHYS